MTRKHMWLGLAAFVLALGLAVACYTDSTGPRYVPPQPGEGEDSTKTQG